MTILELLAKVQRDVMLIHKVLEIASDLNNVAPLVAAFQRLQADFIALRNAVKAQYPGAGLP